jgi:hypothetical protein
MTQQKSLHPIVMKFIARFTNNGKRQEVIDTFSCGCCYWFAKILWNRFTCRAEECVVLYDPIINHWACQIDGIVYDITGVITSDEYQWEPWVEFQYKDELLTKRLYRDCINFEGEEEDGLV